jgi:hypothetical protein
MTNIKNQLAFAIILFSTSCFAIPKPDICPTVTALQSVGVKYAGTSMAGWQVASDKNHFSTKEVWVFLMILGGDKSPNEDAAIATGNSKISSLMLYGGPEKNNSGGWECDYMIPNEDNDHHTIGVAGTVSEQDIGQNDILNAQYPLSKRNETK